MNEGMRPLLENCFPRELSTLRDLFGHTPVEGALPRLNEIHNHTEEKWCDYVAQLRDGRVSYLLIAEAPPWSDAGIPQYVLDPASRSRTLMRALRGAFSVPRQLDASEALTEFAQRGLLIVDSIPFAMDYSEKRSRKYDNLVRLTAESYLRKKLFSIPLTWSHDIRVAFGFKRNGLAVMKALVNRLDLGELRLELKSDQVAVNNAGYPDAGKLRAAYALPEITG